VINRRLRALALVTTLVLAASACGGDDSGDSVEPLPTNDEPSEEPAPSTDGPVSTLPADVPEEYLQAVGPMDIAGDHLPVLATDDIDADPALGSPAPTILGVGFDGEPVRVDAAENGPTMVVFVAHWCPHCNAEIPVYNDLRDEGRFPDELDIVAVSTSPDPSRPNYPPGEWLADMDWTYPAIKEGVDLELQPPWLAAEAYGVSGFPFVTLIDADGNVAARWSGEQDPDETIEIIETRLGL
jgi:thiol-disulfide isomerase/thioredoxin